MAGIKGPRKLLHLHAILSWPLRSSWILKIRSNMHSSVDMYGSVACNGCFTLPHFFFKNKKRSKYTVWWKALWGKKKKLKIDWFYSLSWSISLNLRKTQMHSHIFYFQSHFISSSLRSFAVRSFFLSSIVLLQHANHTSKSRFAVVHLHLSYISRENPQS